MDSDKTAAIRPPFLAANGGADRLAPGARIGQYEIIRELGRGGMGAVHLARDTKLGRLVAIKFILPELLALAAAFLREARATAACHHENIVVVHHVDEYMGLPFMVLEYLEGQPLRALIRGRRIAPQRAVELLVPVARALVRAHELDIVHRDLKPSNIFVTSNGTIKVLDFGIAALLREPMAAAGSGPIDTRPPLIRSVAVRDTGSVSITGPSLVSATVEGTLPYVAPEILLGAAADRGADIWAFGIILYEMLTGHHPIQPHTSDEALMKMAFESDTPLPAIAGDVGAPPRLSALVAACLEKHPERRIASAREVLTTLEGLLPSRVQREYGERDSPYLGLAAFEEGEAGRFFGRGRDVLQVVSRLRQQPVAAIVGPSGVGKSSFVRAGVIPALKASGESWEAFILRPGRQPLQALATLLQSFFLAETSPAGDRLAEHKTLTARLQDEPGYLGAILRARAQDRREKILVFVDQFEELFTLVPEEPLRAAFVSCLAGVADDAEAPLRVLLSLRSDFLDRVGENRRFSDAVARGLVLLQPLGTDALREALTAPVEQMGHHFETAAMVEEIVGALAHNPGALPLLQFAGGKLWEARDRERKILTLASYQAVGGISGALAQHADEVINALSAPMRRLARDLFRRLITADGTRAMVELSELTDLAGDWQETRALVDRLVAARLLVAQIRTDEDTATIELAHESLITGWPLLRRWLDEERDDLAFREQLQIAARQWDARGRPQGLLWRGEAMEEARLWRSRHPVQLSARERDYLTAVLALGSQAHRRRRAIIVGIIASLSLVIAGGAVSMVKLRRAEGQAVTQAVLAEQEARRAAQEARHARSAESQVKAQLEVVRREQEATARAEAEIRRHKEDLRSVNGQLEDALTKANSESRNARRSAAGEHALSVSLQQANQRLESVLAETRARAERLERERRKIMTELK